MIGYEHFPAMAVMGLFLGAFLVEIFGSKNKTVRNILAVGAAAIACAEIVALI